MKPIMMLLLACVAFFAPTPGAAAPEGQMTWAIHVALAPTWFDPAETSGIITPFVVLYALQDAMVKPLPGNPMAGSLAESWSVSPDGLTIELDRKRREATLHRIQQLMHDKVLTAPIWQLAAMTGVGPRVEESGIGLVAGYAFFSAPYEDVKLKGK